MDSLLQFNDKVICTDRCHVHLLYSRHVDLFLTMRNFFDSNNVPQKISDGQHFVGLWTTFPQR